MPERRKQSQTSETRYRPATTPEERETQLIALAYDAAEKEMREGTASSQVITHFLKLGTVREQLERDKIRHENKLLEARRDALAQQGDILDMYTKALKAMSSYQGRDDEFPEEEFEPYEG